MMIGPVQWSNTQKGKGFIQSEGDPKDGFEYISSVERCGVGDLREG
jgi:cold shock CspA family protein